MSFSVTTSVNDSVQAIAFNPKRPNELILPEQPAQLRIRKLHRDSAYDLCNEFELVALRKIIQEFQEFCSAGGLDVQDHEPVVNFARACREHVMQCRIAWNEALNTREDLDIRADKDSIALATIHQLMYLLEVIFPLVIQVGTFEQRGYATANMVRFVRMELMQHPINMHPQIEEMLETVQPEHFEGNLYWEYVYALARQGRLQELCDTLQKHSRMHSTVINQTLLNTFVKLMVHAPLPGGVEEEEHARDNSWDLDCTEAIQQHSYWQDQLKEAAQSQYFEPLFQHLPQLRYVFSILQGNLSQVQFDSWSDELCANLLFRVPFIEPRQIRSLSHRLLSVHGGGDIAFVERTLLAIMGGDLSAGVRLMNESTGGAALPATISAIYNRIMIGLVTYQESRASELFVEATTCIFSALAPKGVFVAELAVRLLLSVIKTNRDMEVIQTLSNVLEHCAATADHEIDLLVEICLPLLQDRGITALTTPLVSLFVERFDYHIHRQRPGDAFVWLIKGRELERSFGRTVGVCSQKLKVECFRIVSNVLSKFISDDVPETVGADIIALQVISEALKPYESSSSMPSAATLLCRVQRIMQLLGDDGSVREIGDLVIGCLQKVPSVDDGVMRSLARVSIQWPLLMIACIAMDKMEKARESSYSNLKECVFDADGVTVLLSTLETLLILGSLDGAAPPVSESKILSLRRSIAMTRCYADVVENDRHTRQEREPCNPLMTVDIVKLPLHEQEKHVKALLDNDWY